MNKLSTAVFETIVGKRSSSHSILERYTEASHRAIFHARQECELRGGTAITVADLLGGLSTEEDTRAERVGSLKANAFYLRWLVGLPALPTHGEIDAHFDESQLELDSEARRAFSFALMEADRDREYWIDSDHLLRGLMRFPNRAHFAILKTEINLDQVRRGSRKDREEFLPEETPNFKVIQYLLRKHAALWLPPLVGLACYLYVMISGNAFGFAFSGK